jgi:hypothetical protein
MTKSNSFAVVRFGKSALLLTSFLAFAACGGNDYSSAEVLPDDPAQEAVDSNTPADTTVEDSTTTVENPSAETPLSEQATTLKAYDYVDPNRVINTTALKNALLYFDQNKSKFANKNYISVIDFSKRSTLARFHIIDMNTGSVWSIHTAHGKGSDADHDGYADKFSNKSGSNASSLGFYKAAETYNGSHGLSLRLDGLSSTNSNARARAVVIHGASYVKESSSIQGRSWGCPAVTMSYRDKVVKALKGGSLIYAYAK